MRKRWFERPPREGEVNLQVELSVATPEGTKAFFEALKRLPAPDPEKEILVPLIMYPFNGRADCISPSAHFYWASERDRAIRDILEEVQENEGREDCELFARLLREHDTVRIGRIVVHMYRLKQSSVYDPTIGLKPGVEVLGE